MKLRFSGPTLPDWLDAIIARLDDIVARLDALLEAQKEAKR